MAGSSLVNTNPRLSPLTEREVVDWIRGRTRAQLLDFIAALEDAIGAPPRGVVREPYPDLDATHGNPPAYVDLSVTLVLDDVGLSRIPVIKVLRRITRWTMLETRDRLARLPQVISVTVPTEQAHAVQAELQALGAVVTIQYP